MDHETKHSLVKTNVAEATAEVLVPAAGYLVPRWAASGHALQVLGGVAAGQQV